MGAMDGFKERRKAGGKEVRTDSTAEKKPR